MYFKETVSLISGGPQCKDDTQGRIQGGRQDLRTPLKFRGKICSQFDKSYVYFNFKLFDYFLSNGNIIINIY